MKTRRLLLVTACLAMPFVSQTYGQVDGVLDGIVGVRLVPLDESTGEPLPPSKNLLVHMIPESDPSVELTAPAGEWFLPPGDSDRFKIWMEGPGLISRRQWLFRWARTPYEGLPPKAVRVPVGPAAVVRLSATTTLTDSESVRLLQLETGFARRLQRDRSEVPVQLPPGQVVACIFDDRENRYVGLSQPTSAALGKPAVISPQRQTPPLSDVLLHFVRPQREAPWAEATVRLRQTQGDVLTPAAMGGDSTNLYAFFYGVSWKSAKLEFASEQFFLQETDLTFGRGGVTYARLPLLEKPSLNVRLLLPETLKGDRTLAVEDHGEIVAQKSLSADQMELQVDHLPAHRMLVKLKAGIWEFVEPVDLSAGTDDEVTFQPYARHVHGRVFRGDDPVEASVAFLASGVDTWAETDTDGEGRYAIDLFSDSGMAQVTPVGSETPSRELLEDELGSDTEIDFHLGNAILDVVVTSGDTGLPLQEALVTAGGVAGQREGFRSSLGTTTDDDGVARLGPLRPSSLVVKVSKAGWTTQRVRVEVASDSPPPVHVVLEPETEVRLLRVTLPDGRPASEARAAVFQSLAGGLAWQGLADAEGLVRVPRRVCCVVTLLHDAAGLTLVQLGSQDNDDELAVRMQPRAAPLRVSAVAADGSAVPWAKVRVWIDGRLVGNEVFGMLFRTPLAANWEGVWMVSGLAPATIEVVCWRSGASTTLNDQGQAGLLDGQRQRFAYPWPNLISVPVIE